MKESLPDGWVRRFLRRGALKHLDVALHDSKGALSWEWVERDPALADLREAEDRDWALLRERYGGKPPRDPLWDAVHERAGLLIEEMDKLSGEPDRPWGDPARRHYAWSVAAGVFIVAMVVLTLMDKLEGLRVALAVVATLATIRAAVLGVETWGSWKAAHDSRGDADVWRKRAIFWRLVASVLVVGTLIYVGVEDEGKVEGLVVLAAALSATLAIVWAVIAAQQGAWLDYLAKGAQRAGLRQADGRESPPRRSD